MARIGYWQPSAYETGLREALRRLIDAGGTAAAALWRAYARWLQNEAPSLGEGGPPGPPGAGALESGDLLWPENPNAVLPYKVASGGTESKAALWLKERDRHLASLASLAIQSTGPALTNADWRRRRLLEPMDYAKFVRVFANDESPDGESPRAGRLGVGHIAIVRIREGTATIVEAVWGAGVREVRYPDWASERTNEPVWHGRVKNASTEARAAIAEYAATQVGKPHNFWNFDLGDESGFYCSKLAWLAILKGTNQAVDGRAQARELLWLSPKRLLGARAIDVLQQPAGYGLPARGRS